MAFRKATIDDLEILIKLRLQQLMEEGQEPTVDIEEELKSFFVEQLTSNQLVQYVIENSGEVVATGAIQFISFPPSYHNTTGIRGYIMNMYTVPMFRKKGLAKQLLDLLLEEAQSRKVQHIFLIASEMGKAVYKKYGFHESDVYMEYIQKEKIIAP